MTAEHEKSTPDELLAIAVPIAREAAATARRMRAEAITAVETKSTGTDVVTAADKAVERQVIAALRACLLYTSPSPRDRQKSRMPSSA